MTSVKDAISAIVDFNFGVDFNQTIAKAVNVTRSYAQQPTPDELKFDMLEAIVTASGLGSVQRSLGGHPDFNHLTGENVQQSQITTLFADLRNFTRYGLFLSPAEMREVKRAVIGSFIYIVHVFDGHVHNIPGDGLMVYFGGPHKEDGESGLNAMMAGASLLYAMENYINPILDERIGFEHRLHMRVGVEYGSVVWGEFGIHEVVEVKATGFSVDFAAKIQQVAETDQMRAGEGIKALIDWQESLFSETQNYTKQLNGVSKTVKHYSFDWKEALNLYTILLNTQALQNLESAAPNFNSDPRFVNPKTRDLFSRALPTSNTYSASIVTKIGPRPSGPFREVYNGNRKLPKNWWLKFTLSHNVPPPFRLEWEAVNNGYEAFQNHIGHINTEASDRKTAYEQTAFSGTHYMVCRVLKNGVEVARALQPVIVK